MKHIAKHILFAMVFILFSCEKIELIRVEGIVTDQTGNRPLSNIKLWLEDLPNESVISDKDGKFSFSNQVVKGNRFVYAKENTPIGKYLQYEASNLITGSSLLIKLTPARGILIATNEQLDFDSHTTNQQELKLENIGTKDLNYKLMDVPEWLMPTELEGEIKANGTKILSFSVDWTKLTASETSQFRVVSNDEVLIDVNAIKNSFLSLTSSASIVLDKNEDLPVVVFQNNSTIEVPYTITAPTWLPVSETEGTAQPNEIINIQLRDIDWETIPKAISSGTIKVQSPFESLLVNVRIKPNAFFTTEYNRVSINEIVQFTNNSKYAQSYTWDFGDGTTSNEANPQHQFSNGNEYTVTLTAKNGDSSDSYTQKIFVGTLHLVQIDIVTTDWLDRNWDYGNGPDIQAILKIDDKEVWRGSEDEIYQDWTAEKTIYYQEWGISHILLPVTDGFWSLSVYDRDFPDADDLIASLAPFNPTNTVERISPDDPYYNPIAVEDFFLTHLYKSEKMNGLQVYFVFMIQ